MTNNQLTYQRNLESERANRAAEAHNRSYLAEIARHNQASEGISWNSLAESIRHNKSSENISMRNLLLGYDQLAETHRYNSEVMRHNRMGEGISLKQLAESVRHNKAGEFNGADLLHLLIKPDWFGEAFDTHADILGLGIRHDEPIFGEDSRPYKNMEKWQNYLNYLYMVNHSHQGSSGRHHGGSGGDW